MKRKDVFSALSCKLGISRTSLENYKVNDGRIYPSFLQSVLTDIKQKLKKDRENFNLVDKFSAKSSPPRTISNQNAICLILHAYSCSAPNKRARIRAECIRPKITDSVLWEFLAIQMETTTDKLDREMLVRNIKLPLAGYDKHS